MPLFSSVLRPCHPCGSTPRKVGLPHGWQGRSTDEVQIPLPRGFHQVDDLPGELVHRLLCGGRQRLADFGSELGLRAE